jgi:tetratricopeptide (TPR) repeat protein
VWAGDWEACYRHIRDVAAIAPQHFSLMEAIRATHLHRPRDAIVALTRPTAERFARSSSSYWLVLTGAYHEIGDHRRELRTVQSARGATPSDPGLLMQELRAYAALGMVDSVQARVDSLREQPRTDWITPGAAWTGVAEELRAHGHDAAATAVFTQAIAWFRQRPAAEAATETHRYFMGAALYSAGELAAADSIFRALHREHPGEVDYAGYLAAIAARQGDTATARRLANELVGRETGAPVPGELSIFWRAVVAALVGNQEEAMRLLVATYGKYGTDELHANRDFDGLRHYAPFLEFLRPKG